ncbi:unnamed protein product [Caenorhabditis angaria]|uniref:Aminopeptidase n=1 Tax=Caenorhabditis angaria TaxID=860376 RepID=A0A9P1I6Z3_9PELO|nr:unnamed protein product [Caenorhabditis angaria]
MKFKNRETPGLLYGSLVLFILLLWAAALIHVLDSSYTGKIREHSIYQSDKELQRIPKLVAPIEYDVQLQLFLPGFAYIGHDHENMTVDGEVVMKLKMLEKNQQFFVSAQEITIHKIEVFNDQRRPIAIRSMDKMLNGVRIVLDKYVDKNQVFLVKIKYCAKIRIADKGLYKSKYKNEYGNGTQIIAITRMEPDHARLVVPCLDEPQYKSVWRMRIIHPKGSTAIFNNDLSGPVVEYNQDFIQSSFLPTPKMSSYLLAMVISDFEYLEKFTRSGIAVRIRSRPEVVSSLKFALEEAVRIFEKWEKTFEIPYPMKKIDIVGIPNYPRDVMENWGLITVRERYLIFDEMINTADCKRKIRSVLSHELIHNWFGNLVTPEYWTSAWLNEGFATLFEDFGADFLANGSYSSKANFVLNAQRIAFLQDSPHRHSPKINPKSGKSLETYFDFVIHQKSAAILHMIRKVIGENVFMAAIRMYLQENQYGNVNDEILLGNLQKSFDNSGPGKLLDISKFVQSWTQQTGYPIDLYVKNGVNSKNARWEIPIYYQNLKGERNEEPIWMSGDSPIHIKSSTPIILNVDSDCYYRVEYPETYLKTIFLHLAKNPQIFSSRTKLRLIDDAFELFPSKIAFSMMQNYISQETKRLPISAYLKNSQAYPEIANSVEFLESLRSGGELDRGWEFVAENYLVDEEFENVKVALYIIQSQCDLNQEICLKNVDFYFQQLLETCQDTDQISKCSRIPGPFRTIVYCKAVAQDTSVKILLEKWLKMERNVVEAENLENGLWCAK